MAGCPTASPCEPWATAADLCCLTDGNLPGTCVGDTPVDIDQIKKTIDSASYILWALSGRQFGVCQVKVRPCGRDECPGNHSPFQPAAAWGQAFVTPLLYMGQWYNLTCGCGGQCSCTATCEVSLPSPVCEIVEVKQDGVVLGQSLYRVDDWKRLVRTGGAMFTQPITGLVSGDVVVSGPDPVPAGNGVVLPTDGNTYVVDLGGPFPVGTGRLDSMYEFEIPPGCIGLSFNVFGLGGGAFEVDSVSGGMTVTQVGQNVTVGPVQLSNQYGVVRVRSTAEGGLDTQAYVNVVNGCGQLKLTKVSWADPDAKLICWPLCQDMDAEDTEIGTWSITVRYGLEVPAAGKLAAGELACEMLKACVGKDCSLPSRITSLTRQGVSATFFDPMDFLDSGKTGMYLVDLFIKAANPYGLAARPSVWSPDIRPGRVTNTASQ